jgi:hypothetical protein
MSLAHHIWSSPIGWSWPMSLEFEEVDSEEWQISIWEDNTDQISWRTNGIPCVSPQNASGRNWEKWKEWKYVTNSWFVCRKHSQT